MKQNLSLSVDTLDDVILTDEDLDVCEVNITWVELSGSVLVNFEKIEIGIGGDVPQGVGFLKFTKYLYQKINWLRQGIRKNMETDFQQKIGNSLRTK